MGLERLTRDAVETFKEKQFIIPNKEVFKTLLKIIPFYVKTF
jgi:hypothetical protein